MAAIINRGIVTAMPTINKAYTVPRFSRHLVESFRNDGYWVEGVNIAQSGRPDLVSFGVNLGEVFWHRNADWERFTIAKLRMPVGMDQAEIARSGRSDPVICYEIYGEGGTIEDPDPNGGKISWFENPGAAATATTAWQQRYIGQSIGMHRIRVGHFTRDDKWEVLGFPIALDEVHALVPIVMFTEPNDVLNALEWIKSIVDDTHFRVIHGVEKKRGLVPESDLDSVIVASEAGVHWLYFDVPSGTWRRVKIGDGELSQFEKTGFKGSGEADVGAVNGDKFAYVASQEPFHGNTIAVYCKESGASPETAQWTRHVLDVFGDPNTKGEGPGHQVICADFDGDGDDELLVALRGPAPWKGVFYYKAIDLQNGVFAKWRVADDSAARIALGDFNGDGKLDFATIGYSVRGYYVEENPKIVIYLNEM